MHGDPAEARRPQLVIHEILPVGMLQCNCSIFGDEATREALVIDPGDQIEDILEILKKHSLKVKAIVITHAHIDHLDVQASWLGMPKMERTEIDTAAKEGDSLSVGATAFHILHTPGHTQGSI